MCFDMNNLHNFVKIGSSFIHLKNVTGNKHISINLNKVSYFEKCGTRVCFEIVDSCQLFILSSSVQLWTVYISYTQH